MHQATEAELLLRARERQDRVTLLHCGACLLTCSLNATHNIIGCAMCDARSVSLARKAGVQRLLNFDRRQFPEHFPTELPATVDELMELSVDGVNLGRGAASSTISILREYALDPRGRHRALVELQLCNALGALRNYQRVLAAERPDEVIIFNGRHSELWPLLGLCERLDIPFVTHERAGSDQLFQLFANSLPHSIATRRRLMNELWESTPEPERAEAANHFFRAKRGGTSTDDRSYLGRQQAGTLPKEFDASRHNLVIFNSSEDEMQAIKEWITPLYRQQNEVIQRLLSTLRAYPAVRVYLRMHPNLTGVDNQQTRELYGLDHPGLTLIRPEEKVDTYALLEAADVVLTFASSVGAEATFWGTPSVLYGRAFYEGDDAVYEPQSFAELLRLVLPPAPPPKKAERILKYGYFVSHYGEPYRFAEIENTKTARVQGRPILRFTWLTLLKLLRLLPQLPRWWRTHRTVIGHRLRLREWGRLYSHLRKKD